MTADEWFAELRTARQKTLEAFGDEPRCLYALVEASLAARMEIPHGALLDPMSPHPIVVITTASLVPPGLIAMLIEDEG